MAGSVVVVGLGPGDESMVTSATLTAIESCSLRFTRTLRHPSVGLLGDPAAGAVVSFDEVYDAADSLDEVYTAIVERVVAAAEAHGRVLYAVPGSPAVRERSVALLRADPRVDVEVIPALSFLELAWTQLGIDPIAERVQVVDGHRFASDAAGLPGPMLVCHCDRRDALSEIKLTVDPWPDELPIVVQRLGLPDEHIASVEWADLDRVVEPDHLTSVYLPRLVDPVGTAFANLVELMRTLRAECPWDREQTHASLRRYLLEESYEVLEAIDGYDSDSGEGAEHLEEELGDLLFQVVFHSALGSEEGWFTLADVATTVTDKLRERHPHVFAGSLFLGVDELRASWEEQKLREKGRASIYEGIPAALPSLAYAAKVLRKAASAGHDVQLQGDPTAAELLAIVAEANGAGIDAEQALRTALDRWLASQ